MTQKVARNERLSLRTSSAESDRIRLAADATGRSVTDFVLAAATTAAERVLADQMWFELDQARSDEFQALLDRPAIYKPRLSALMSGEDPYVD